MYGRTKTRRRLRKVIFMADGTARSRSTNQSAVDISGNVTPNADIQSDSSVPEDSRRLIDGTENDLSSEGDVEDLLPRGSTMAAHTRGPPVPELFTTLPPIRDVLSTETSTLQDRMVQECLPYLLVVEGPSKSPFDFNSHGLPRLDRESHVEYLHGSLGKLPRGFVGADASRPWLLYWALTGLYLLGEDISHYRDQVISTLSPMQNAGGGFGGGHGQLSHCASSYAAILSLAMVGGNEALGMIDRKMLWRWLGDLKQPDGSFQVCVGGEEDVRGAYCSMVMISLLNLPMELPHTSIARITGDETFLTGLPQYLSRCQTFEGGIAGSPGTEAHGAYAFCALACLCIVGEPRVMINEYLDVPLLLSWLSARQHAPEGGFAGRTNKLVDGCYSHWVGGCWPLLEAALNGPRIDGKVSKSSSENLYSREGLIRYILCCCQSAHGGLRDKPSKHPDSYHSCYILAGLSSAQHHYHFAGSDSADPAGPMSSPFQWTYSPTVESVNDGREEFVFDEEDRLKVVHPLYIIPWGAAEETHSWYNAIAGF